MDQYVIHYMTEGSIPPIKGGNHMSKLLCRILCLTAAMVILFTVGASASTIWYVKTDDGKNLNVRSDPWKAPNNVIDKIPYRTPV